MWINLCGAQRGIHRHLPLPNSVALGSSRLVRPGWFAVTGHHRVTRARREESSRGAEIGNLANGPELTSREMLERHGRSALVDRTRRGKIVRRTNMMPRSFASIAVVALIGFVPVAGPDTSQ